MSQGQTSQRLRPFKPLRFGRYTLLMPISTGGMGEIFLARLEGSHGFDKLCVIKKILPHLAQDQDFVSRFVDEAHILVKLSHGNIAQVLDMGVHEHEPYIALEFVDGKDLRRVLSRMRERQLPLPLSFVLSVMTRVLDALAYAHRKRGDDDDELNLVHRDVSPQNVLISYEGEVKVIDFGLAKSALSLSRTNPSIVMGKFMYMAPEQARHRTVDRRSDLYAVGLCLWELVTGKNAFEEVPQGALMGEVANPSIPPLNTIEPLCPQVLSDVVARALSLDPAQRFQTAEEFRGRLQSILQDIDPQAGAESTSRFMRDAFSAEYQGGRRMLNTVKEQAKAHSLGMCAAPTVFRSNGAGDGYATYKTHAASIGRSILDHVKFKHRTGDAAKRYDVLQSLAYLVVIFGLLPLVVVCGLALSPRLNTVFTGWVDLLGGRQSARSLHFLAAAGLVLFVIVHVAQVFIAGVWNEMRSIITGWYGIPEEHPKQEVRP